MYPVTSTISRRSWILAWAAIGLGVAAIYRHTFEVFFLNEDFIWLWRCRLGSPRDIWPVISRDVMGGTYSWRPLVQLSFALNEAVSGLHPGTYRAEVLVWHVLGAGLVLAIGRRLAGVTTGVIAAGVFAVHPLQVESLAWTCARGGPISTAFLTLAVWMYLYWREGRVSPAAIIIPFAFALATQESAVVLIPLLVAGDLLLDGSRPTRHRYLTLYGGLLVVIVANIFWRSINSSAHPDLALAPDLQLGQWARASMGLAKLATAAAMTLTVSNGAVAVFIVLAVFAIWRWWTGHRLALWGLAWMVIAIGPSLLFLFGPFPRYFHLALAGFGLLVADLSMAVWEASRNRWRLSIAVFLLVAALAWGVRMTALIDGELIGYRKRSDMTEQFLREIKSAVPQAAPASTFAFYRVGDLRAGDGVFIFGLEDAVRLLYDDGSLRVVFPELGKGVGVTYDLAYVDGHLWRLRAEP